MTLPISGRVEITKNNRKSETYFSFYKGARICVCGLTVHQMWLLVLEFYGVTSGSLLPNVVGGQFQKGTEMSHSSYVYWLGKVSEKLKMPRSLTEHSARRGG